VEAFKKAGVSGILINHSEKRLQDNQIEYLIKKCKRFDLTSIICGKDPEECYKLSKYNPDIIAIEPPELIGTGNSVSRYKPESISKTVELVKNFNKNIHVICGAGISDEEDVKIALELGAEGILVSSSIIKSKEPYEKIRKFAMIIKEWKS
jgi:Triosephosphate isomerase